MTPPTLISLLCCAIAAMFDWRIASALALALTWLLTGHDPLWLAAAALTWLRGLFISFGVGIRVGIRAAAKTRSVSVEIAREQAWAQAMLPVRMEER